MTLTQTGRRRIERLISFMEKLPKNAEKHFDMSAWFYHEDDDHKHKIGRYVTPTALGYCGTTACALGWAATIPAFKKAGLVVETESSGPKPMARAVKFFQVDHTKANQLFGYGILHDNFEVKTPKQWAKRARRLLKKWTRPRK